MKRGCQLEKGNYLKLPCIIAIETVMCLMHCRILQCKAEWFGDLVRLFSSSRQCDMAYLGWFVWDLVGTLLYMETWKKLVKAH